ncbi:MAG: D-hexose-6-phosphate mutarotase [Prolixibacteraceae bacterium]
MEEEIDLLNEQFSIEGEIGFSEQEGDLVYIDVINKYAEATISLYGAHIIQYNPYNTVDVLWMSPASNFEQGKAIRGGIPICFPWFGPHATDANLPAHGFARILPWNVTKTESSPKGETLITLELNSSEETLKYWPYSFKAELDISVGPQLKVELRITNTGQESFEYTSAIHTYFTISQISNIKIEGLQGASYYSGFGKDIFTQESEFIEIEKEENRRYVNTDSEIILHDPVFRRKIKTSKQGSKVTVVWNPWSETVKTMSDIPEDGYETFVCIEPANSYDDFVKLAPGEKHSTIGVIGLLV